MSTSTSRAETLQKRTRHVRIYAACISPGKVREFTENIALALARNASKNGWKISIWGSEEDAAGGRVNWPQGVARRSQSQTNVKLTPHDFERVLGVRLEGRGLDSI